MNSCWKSSSVFFINLLSVSISLMKRGLFTFNCWSQVTPRSKAMLSFSKPSQIDGLCAVMKPKGVTSRFVVDEVKNILQSGSKYSSGRSSSLKIGHGGTLDPMAEGVLVIGVGTGTKLLDKFLAGTKGYTAVALLGSSTDTLDITGTVLATRDCSFVTNDQLQSSLSKFRGDILQIPPMFSALRKDGKRLYDLARSGIEVERSARPVTVFRLELTAGKNLPYFGLDIECGGGTYVRSLIDDICRDVGAMGCMTELVRTKQAVFTLDHCLEPGDWTQENIIRHIQKCNSLAGITDEDLAKSYKQVT